jgi:sterol desaturase/sphingolipid hydroxylase (fatty acid hydroxylase superfamily)
MANAWLYPMIVLVTFNQRFAGTVSLKLDAPHLTSLWHVGLSVSAWTIGSCIAAEFLGYWLHRLMHSGAIRFLSRNHMKHHLIFYGPLQRQRSETYRDATDGTIALGNIGLEWLMPAGLFISIVMAVFHLLHVPLIYQLLSLATSLTWSFLMFSYLHDVMHVDGFWLAKNPWLKHWFLSARRLHDIHHRVLNDSGLMDQNFGIGFFAFDRLFGTLTLQQPPFNRCGYEIAREKFKYLETSGTSSG